MQNLTVSIIQTSLHWEDRESNLNSLDQKIGKLNEKSDLIVLPEMFSSGFTMNPSSVAEPMDGPSVKWMEKIASSKNTVITGSLVIQENDRYYNRLIWMQPDGQYSFYDKKHLFSYSGEDKFYSPGKNRLIVNLKGWKIMPLICYDMRFAAWSHNTYDPDEGFLYDCLLYVANWPESRSHAWRVLLMARAIENQSYVIGVNRIGEDGNNIHYSGDSAIIDPRGENISEILPGTDSTGTWQLSSCQLNSYRNSFRAWADWDRIKFRD